MLQVDSCGSLYLPALPLSLHASQAASPIELRVTSPVCVYDSMRACGYLAVDDAAAYELIQLIWELVLRVRSPSVELWQ